MDDIDLRVRLRDLARFNADANSAARHIDNIGDQARQASRKIAEMNRASKDTRVNLGPFSTSMKGGALAVGALALGVKNLTPQVLGAVEALGVMAGGAGAAGGVGVLALAQGAGVAKLAVGNLTKALGGNATALKKLSPQARDLFFTLNDAQQKLADTATGSFLPGLTSGASSALRNLPVINRLVGQTGGALGGLASRAGGMLGGADWGRDIGTVGRANVQIITNLGNAGLHLADGFRHIAVEAAPLAVWLSRMADKGALATSSWLANARRTGEMAHFFAQAKQDLKVFADATGHTAHGILNLFGAQDVNGTKTLQSLDRITRRFDRWTSGPALAHGLGNALVAEIPKLAGKAVGLFATSMAHSGALAAKLFWQAFLNEDTLAKVITGGFLAKKLGLLGLGKSLGRRGGIAAGLLSGGKGSASDPLYVIVKNQMPGGPRAPGEPAPGKGPSTISKVGKWGARAGGGGVLGWLATLGAEVAAPAALAVAPTAGLVLAAQLSRRNDATHHGAYASSTLQSFRPLSGQNPQTMVRTDAQGFPIGGPVEIHVTLDGRELQNAQATVIRRQRGRRAGP